MKGKRRNSDSHGQRFDSPAQPRLVTLKYMRYAKKMREELSGETEKKARSSVTLPKFSWDKKNDA
jgi:hypothetical protein